MAGLGGEMPAFDELFEDDRLKDTEVIIVEEGDNTHAAERDGAGHKRSRPETSGRSITVAAHCVVLFSLSPYFRAKLRRWSRDEQASKRQQQEQQQDQQPPPSYQHSLQLLVPPGQLELGRRLITAMYSSSLDLSDLEAPQLMQLAALAECYGVGKVVTAAAAQLHHLIVNGMPLQAAAAVFELPEACLALPAFQAVQQQASDKLQQELGDLEVVWSKQEQQDALLGLPFGALLQLLRDERTRVASEDTAVYTAVEWLERHPEALAKASQLLAVLRLPHCSATFLTHGGIRQHLCAWGVPEDEMYQLGALCALGDKQPADWLAYVSHHHPQWQMSRRPVSVVKQLQQEWQLPLSQLKPMFERAQLEGARQMMVQTETSIWQGREWQCGVYVEEEGEFGFFLKSSGPARFIDSVQVTGSQSGKGITWCGVACHHVFLHAVLRYGVIEPSEPITWAQLQQQLEERYLNHAGDVLHISLTISDVA